MIQEAEEYIFEPKNKGEGNLRGFKVKKVREPDVACVSGEKA
jgi:hypothetical protein